jgi:hypothetical protein
MDEQSLAALRSDLGGEVGVWPEHVEIVRAFCAGGTQWRTSLRPAGLGFRPLYLGLDYAGVRIALDALAIPVTPRLWVGLAIMEQAAVAALNEDLS